MYEEITWRVDNMHCNSSFLFCSDEIKIGLHVFPNDKTNSTTICTILK